MAHPISRQIPAGIDTTRNKLRGKPLILGSKHRRLISEAVKETCSIRKWDLLAFNVRTNHVHTVVVANKKTETVLKAFKANATRKLREEGLWSYGFSPWARKGSKRKLWTEKSVGRAIDYVLNNQGDELPDFDD